MISYHPLWTTLKKKNITTYALTSRYGVSRGTLDSLKQGRNISTATLDSLCGILSCRVEDVLAFVSDGDTPGEG